ncbi:phosphoribosyltransferase [Streptomyces sp. MS06]|uniref:phosphoribosyltransferase n=1 Tax=Streptomyces sp. MS06 TaxID=3385974 RepID=UPI0039A24DC1
MRFRDRTDAGRRLAARLEHLRGADPVVLGLPRGGVPVAREVADALGAPLDVLVVRKLGVPWRPELGFGAVGESGVRVLNRSVLAETGLRPAGQAAVEEKERAELDRRVAAYRRGRRPRPVTGRTAVVVDDGVATGATAEAACRIVRGQGAARVVLAVPVGAEEALRRLAGAADEVVCPERAQRLGSVGAWYDDFTQVDDREVTVLLAEAGNAAPAAPAAPAEHGRVVVPAGRVRLAARLDVPESAPAVVAFARAADGGPDGDGAADTFGRAGLGTLVLDLLTEDEQRNRHNVFDIVLLARRLSAATLWLRRRTGLPVAYFAEGTGAAAALEAAAEPAADVRAIVSVDGRPDLARPAALAHVRAPTLFLTGAEDARLPGMCRLAGDWMDCENGTVVLSGAGASVVESARDWFTGHLLGVAS